MKEIGNIRCVVAVISKHDGVLGAVVDVLAGVDVAYGGKVREGLDQAALHRPRSSNNHQHLDRRCRRQVLVHAIREILNHCR